MQRSPALVVAAVDVGAVLDQELDHLQVVIDAGLKFIRESGSVIEQTDAFIHIPRELIGAEKKSAARLLSKQSSQT